MGSGHSKPSQQISKGTCCCDNIITLKLMRYHMNPYFYVKQILRMI